MSEQHPCSVVALAYASARRMKLVDEVATEQFGIGFDQMVEQAARAVVAASARLLGGMHQLVGRRVLIMCGPGHNGTGGLASVRHLITAGCEVSVLATRAWQDGDEVTQAHGRIVESLEVPVWPATTGVISAVLERSGPWDLVIDALVGYSGKGTPKGVVRRVVEAFEEVIVPTIALDVPTGVSATNGRCGSLRIRPTATVTLGVPKRGMLTARGWFACGAIWVATLGLPEAVWRAAEVEGDLPVFEADGLVALDASALDELDEEEEEE